MRLILFLLLILFFANCKESKKSTLEGTGFNSERQTLKDKVNKSSVIQQDTIIYVSQMSFAQLEDVIIKDTILNTFVTNIRGARRFLKPNSQKRVPEKFNFGSPLDRIYTVEGLKGWCLTESTVRADTLINNVRYRYDTNNVLVYINCNDVATEDNLKINDNDLNFGGYYNYKTEVRRKDITIDSLLQISSLSKTEFDGLNKTKYPNFIVSNSVKKNNEIIKLPIEKEPFYISFKDGKGQSKYEYYGEIPFLNSHLISEINYKAEEHIYAYYSKTNGKQKETFIDYPYISPDKKHIISIHNGIYESSTAIQLAVINSKNVENKYHFTFAGWLPHNNSIEDYYWLDNNTIVFKAILNIKDYTDNFVSDYFYIKIEIQDSN